MFDKLFITGTSRGLGRSLLNYCRQNNITAYSHSRNSDSDIRGDITSSQTQRAIINFIEANKINVLINNAGIYMSAFAEEITELDTGKMVSTNLIAPINLTCAALGIFKSRGFGKVYNIGSLAGIMPSKYESIYCATKFGIKGFTDSIKEELKPYRDINAYNIIVGAMRTDMCKNRESYEDLADPNEVAKYIIEHCQINYTSIETDIIIRRK
jgi:short-subunit dehydrogenase